MTEHPEEASSRSSPASRHPITAYTKTRRRTIEILLETDQRGMLSFEDSEEPRSFVQLRAVSPTNHTKAPTYTGEILDGLYDHLSDVDETVQTYVQGQTLKRMPATDRVIVRAVTWEIVHNDEVGMSITVDEVITLSWMLSTGGSPRYLGGLLGHIGDLADMLR